MTRERWNYIYKKKEEEKEKKKLNSRPRGKTCVSYFTDQEEKIYFSEKAFFMEAAIEAASLAQLSIRARSTVWDYKVFIKTKVINLGRNSLL